MSDATAQEQEPVMADGDRTRNQYAHRGRTGAAAHAGGGSA
ncbi:hypothetical protein [Streptomyces sp. NBC_00140]|nr:hypothetical protein [Streptomyces sp. NBC_00140]MCX5328337.1 hypothetical protein [Streptomyces sp. NBC_00140]